MAKNNKSSNRRTEFSSPNRRKFLIGAGSIAAGGSALLGTAATTTFSLNDRAVSANVVTDADAAVKLDDQEASGIVNLTDGELEIDFAEGSGATGVNVGSVVTVGGDFEKDSFGSNSESGADVAFDIVNQTTDTVDVDMALSLDVTDTTNNAAASGGTSTSSRLQFKISDGAEAILEVGGGTTNSDSLDTASFSVPSGEALGVCVRVFADELNSSTSDDLSSTLDITATQN